MTDSRYYDFTLRLTDIRDLFREPDLDPFMGSGQSLSGVDQLITELKPKSLNRKVRTTLLLPKGQISADLVQATHTALQKYCAARIYQLTHELASLRWQGLKALQTGLIFLAVCLLLSTLFEGLTVLPEFVRRILGEGFLIVGWVSLWHPTELLLYEWWPHWRDRQLHERLGEMELSIEAQG